MPYSVEPKYLVMVETKNSGRDNVDHNKYYNMFPDPGGATFHVEYGRVGARAMTRVYPISKWISTYKQKIDKGYSDNSYLHNGDVSVSAVSDSDYKEIEDSIVKKLIDGLLSFAKNTIRKKYVVKSGEVTEAMIEEAESLINSLTFTNNVFDFNYILLKLFKVIPRRMSNVNAYLADSEDDFQKIMFREQEVLETMKGQVRADIKLKKTSGSGDSKNEGTILEKMGLEIRECTSSETEEIKSHMDSDSQKKFKRAFRVVNKETEEKYEKFKKEHHITKRGEKFLYHGSRNENFWSIISTGLSLSPNAAITGKMFGNGIYFAPKAAKSIGYTSSYGFWARRGGAKMHDKGYLAVYKVATGKRFITDDYKSEYSNFTQKNMDRLGCDSFHAKAGKCLLNDEIIVYREDQCTIRYLIEIG